MLEPAHTSVNRKFFSCRFKHFLKYSSWASWRISHTVAPRRLVSAMARARCAEVASIIQR
ncbi:Uncharacterised protein [Mycobacteroides abscessus subsp. abscessus]|nr:Uncharacterised protein [Mycobacteroides abscessus subsp. abscessus]